jgi:hypothetical protein
MKKGSQEAQINLKKLFLPWFDKLKGFRMQPFKVRTAHYWANGGTCGPPHPPTWRTPRNF